MAKKFRTARINGQRYRLSNKCDVVVERGRDDWALSHNLTADQVKKCIDKNNSAGLYIQHEINIRMSD